MFCRVFFTAQIIAIALVFSQISNRARASDHSYPFSISGLHFDLNLKTNVERERFVNARNIKGESINLIGLSSSELNPQMLWSQLDSEKDHIEGTSTMKAFSAFPELLTNKNEIIVAVIDGGVDIHHEDLQGKIWMNPEHDHDGYVGDLNGWNFIGALGSSRLECTRELAKLMKKQKLGSKLTDSENAYFSILMKDYGDRWDETNLTIKKFTAFQEIYASKDADQIKVLNDYGLSAQDVDAILEIKKNEIAYSFNFDFDESLAIQDHPEVLNEKGYGNGDVMGPNPKHGTHVAGIIAADRLNGIGILGQSQNVKIMPLRVVPDGDERDKDVGNAIRFAVDHHARIINMSFGKAFSPQKDYVDQAVKYAEDHDVLIVHSAGNDGLNLDSFDKGFPNKKLISQKEYADNWIEVGASNPHSAFDPKTGDSLAADFSNCGKHSVDLFAPGTEIYSTVPVNRYASLQGTSMAAPEVSGIAALLLQLNPKLSAPELKSILMASVIHYPGLDAIIPGTLKNVAPKNSPRVWDGDPILFSELSESGGIVNAFQAIKLLKAQY
jgi:subtilisin family serine protease